MEIRHHTVHANGIRQPYLGAGQALPSSFFTDFLRQIMRGGIKFWRSRPAVRFSEPALVYLETLVILEFSPRRGLATLRCTRGNMT
jgi:hypothetical protein